MTTERLDKALKRVDRAAAELYERLGRGTHEEVEKARKRLDAARTEKERAEKAMKK